MNHLKDSVVELHKQWNNATNITQPRDITTEFLVRSKLRDLNAACKVWSMIFPWMERCSKNMVLMVCGYDNVYSVILMILFPCWSWIIFVDSVQSHRI